MINLKQPTLEPQEKKIENLCNEYRKLYNEIVLAVKEYNELARWEELEEIVERGISINSTVIDHLKDKEYYKVMVYFDKEGQLQIRNGKISGITRHKPKEEPVTGEVTLDTDDDN